MRKILFFLILFLFTTEKLLANIKKPTDSLSNSVENNLSIPYSKFCKESSKMMDLKNIDNQKVKFLKNEESIPH